MINLGLTDEEWYALRHTLMGWHGDRIVYAQVHMLDLDHNSLGLVQAPVMSGQVNFDSHARPTRQLQIQFSDPDGNLEVDTEDGRPRLDRMLRVHYTVWVPPLEEWIAIPLFTGPIKSTSREGEEVSVEASGKEEYASGPTMKARTFAKGLNRVNVIRVLMKELTGESRFRLPYSWPARLAKPISMGKQSSAWTYALHVARSMNGQLFYDGRGTLRLRKRPVRSVFTFRDGDGGLVITKPRVTESSEDLINAVRVTGAMKKGTKTPHAHIEFLDPTHVYAPHGMKRGDRPKYYLEEIKDDTLRSKNEVRWKARRRIKELQVDQQKVEFSCLPFPLLEEDDPIIIETDGAKVTARAEIMSIPVGPEGAATVGFLAPVTKRKKWSQRP